MSILKVIYLEPLFFQIAYILVPKIEIFTQIVFGQKSQKVVKVVGELKSCACADFLVYRKIAANILIVNS